LVAGVLLPSVDCGAGSTRSARSAKREDERCWGRPVVDAEFRCRRRRLFGCGYRLRPRRREWDSRWLPGIPSRWCCAH